MEGTDDINGLTVRNRQGQTPEMYLYGVVGDKHDGVTAAQFVKELDGLRSAGSVALHINSEGGLTGDGLAIYNALKRFPGRKVVMIDGIALSAASFIAMAGDEVRMAKNAMWMMHNAWDVFGGDAVALRKKADDLDRWTGLIAGIYSERSKMPRDRVLSLLSAETWLDAEAAKAMGFVDAIEGEMRVAAKFDPSKFRNVPRMALERIGEKRPGVQLARIETERMRQAIARTGR